MSRKTVAWRKKIGRTWSNRGQKGRTETHKSGNGGSIDGLIPTDRVASKGVKQIYDNVSGTFSPGKAGSSPCTLPMKPEKEARIRALVPKK